MEELTSQQLGYIRHTVSKVNPINKILSEEFPDASITVIMGRDNFSYESYIFRAYFGEIHASMAKGMIPPNGDDPEISDSYNIVTGSVQDINRGRILCGGREYNIDDIHREMIYMFLENELMSVQYV